MIEFWEIEENCNLQKDLNANGKVLAWLLFDIIILIYIRNFFLNPIKQCQSLDFAELPLLAKMYQ